MVLFCRGRTGTLEFEKDTIGKGTEWGEFAEGVVNASQCVDESGSVAGPALHVSGRNGNADALPASQGEGGSEKSGEPSPGEILDIDGVGGVGGSGTETLCGFVEVAVSEGPENFPGG